jgi:PIN domain nuclease of toxin-antitoxin system
MLADSAKLPATYRAAAKDRDICWVFHQVSLWEIQIKYDLGKLQLSRSPEELFPEAIIEAGFSRGAIEDGGIFLLGKLPPIHRDPFDRLLISHALLHGWEIATVDPLINKYPVRIFPGR